MLDFCYILQEKLHSYVMIWCYFGCLADLKSDKMQMERLFNAYNKIK